MEIRVNATRMELLRLKRRAELARRGHKLLKDKLDGLVQNFIQTSKDVRKLYDELRGELVDDFGVGAISAAGIDRESYAAALLYPTLKTHLDESTANLMGVKVPRYEVRMGGQAKCFGDMFFTDGFIDSLEAFRVLLPKIVRLAELFKAVQKIGRAIIEIKRRVNALEYIMIPELDSKVRFIKMKLSEMERSNIVSLMKIKEIVRAERR